MRAILDFLISLQQTDTEIIEKVTLFNKPCDPQKQTKAKETPMDEPYRMERHNYEVKRRQYIENQKEIVNLRDLLASHKKTRKTISTNVALDNYEKKLSALKHMISEEDAALPKLAKELAEILANLEKTRKLIIGYKEEIDTKLKERQKQHHELQSDIELLYSKRDQIVSSLPPHIYSAYIGMINTFAAKVVVEVKDMICQGCFIALPRYLYIRLLNPDNMYTCINCSRIIYRRPL